MKRNVYLLILAPVALLVAGEATAQSAKPAVGPSPFSSATRLVQGDLAMITGRENTALEIRAQNTAVVSNNSVSGHSQTGQIQFDAQAFQGVNGLTLLSANTGNNVSINSSLNVNVAIQH